MSRRHRKIAGLLPFLLFCASASAWEVEDHFESPDSFILTNRGAPIADLGGVIANESRRLETIVMRRLVKFQSDTIQADLRHHLEMHHPRELQEALESAGNLHNPALTALRKPFESALLKTRFVASINAQLLPHGYRIAGVSFEKFFIIKDSNPPEFDALIYLSVTEGPRAQTRGLSLGLH